MGKKYGEMTVKERARVIETQNKYIKENYRRHSIKVHKTLEKDMYEHLEKIDNIQQYIKELIKKDMKSDN